MKINKIILSLIAIVIIAFFLRVNNLGIVPPSPDWDEAALGYNAYSLLQTGRDEYGKFLPIVFRSFDDYKPPLYIYLTIPSVALFGLNVFAVRFPSAILGTLTVLITFFLVRRLFENNNNKNLLALLSAFLLAISPWHLQFSRVAFETNSALFFNVLGIWLFLEGLKRPKVWILAVISFGLAPYTYHSARVFTPLLILGCLLIWRKDIWFQKKYAAIAGTVLFLITIPLLSTLLSPEGRLRIKGVSILADQTNILSRDITKIEDDQKSSFPLVKVLHNRRITYARLILDGYLRHYDIKWLFFDGDNPRHHAPGMGLMYLWELPFFLFGIYKLFCSSGKEKYLIFWWFFMAPVAAAPTTELPHAVRTLTFLPIPMIFTTLGIVGFMEILKTWQWWKKIVIIPISLFILFNCVYYFHQYHGHLSLETSKSWQYGYKQVVDDVKSVYSDYDKIVVSTKLEEPHMFFLFYLKYDPRKYLAGGGTTPGGFAKEFKKFDKFEFRPINESKENFDGKTLFIGTPRELSLGYKSFFNLDGTESFRMVGK